MTGRLIHVLQIAEEDGLATDAVVRGFWGAVAGDPPCVRRRRTPAGASVTDLAQWVRARRSDLRCP
ncbi:MAG: hypothetical protein ABSF69_15375 [Polyangiaceae bacterium]|jgi:hypothetical protein